MKNQFIEETLIKDHLWFQRYKTVVYIFLFVVCFVSVVSSFNSIYKMQEVTSNSLVYVLSIAKLAGILSVLTFNIKYGKINFWEVLILLVVTIVMFAEVYTEIYVRDPEAFAGIKNILKEHAEPAGSAVSFDAAVLICVDFFYFSTVTFTTVGYGDITAVSVTAKMFTVFEIMFSYSFFVIYIALFFNTNKNGTDVQTKAGKN